MKAHFWFKTVLCGLLAGLLTGFVLTTFLRLSLSPRVSHRSEDNDSSLTIAKMRSSRAALFKQLLTPYLTKLKEAGTLPPSDIFKFRAIVATWLHADTSSCAEFLDSVGMALLVKRESDSLLSGVALDARSVLDEAARLPTPELRDSFLRVAIMQLAEKDPVEALQATHSLPLWLLKSMQKRVAETWVKKDVRGALESYFNDQTVDRREVFTYAIRAASKENLEEAFDLIRSLPSSSFQHYFSKDDALFEVIAPLDEEKDPRLLWACLQKLPESSLARKNCTTRLALIEAARGNVALPEAANLKSTYLIQDVAWQATHKGKSLEEIQGILDQIPGINGRSKIYKEIAGYQARKAPEQTLKWAATIADPPTRAAAFTASFKEWVSRTPEKAIAYALVDRSHDATTRRQLDLQLLDLAYSEAPDINKSVLGKGFRQLSPVQQAQVKEQITSTFDPVAAKKVLELFK